MNQEAILQTLISYAKKSPATISARGYNIQFFIIKLLEEIPELEKSTVGARLKFATKLICNLYNQVVI